MFTKPGLSSAKVRLICASQLGSHSLAKYTHYFIYPGFPNLYYTHKVFVGNDLHLHLFTTAFSGGYMYALLT